MAVSIRELPAIVLQLLEGEPCRSLSGAQGRPGLSVRYLRRKPGRGLAIVYNAGNHFERWVTVTLGEAALAGSQIRLPALNTGAILTVQLFPADNSLPALAACCAPVPGGPVFSSLERAARIQLCDPSWQLTGVKAEPVRYKPAGRCVIRYRLRLERVTPEGILQRDVSLFGKLYSHPEQARTVHAKMQQLYEEQAEAGEPVIPRPLGIEETLGLTLSEAIQPPNGAEPKTLRTGLRALHPRFLRESGGKILDVIPGEELRLTAIGLARLHTSAVRPAGAPRTGAEEAKRVRERAQLIATRYPAQAEAAERLGNQLASRLEALQPGVYRPAHGGFKPSQLLFHPQRVFMVDLDGFCAADPALDAGYFLAYLHPSGLWYHGPGMRQWFEGSAASFLNAYRQALRERCVEDALVDGILERTRLYEAALLFKIATRRVNRLNSPRPGELSAMLAEIVDLMK